MRVHILLATMAIVALVVLACTSTMIMPTYIKPGTYSLASATATQAKKATSKLVAEFSPTVVRVVKVIRNGKVVYETTKIGDPITLQWYRLVANWMFGLYYVQQQQVIDINGNNKPVFDNENNGIHPELLFYVSNSTEPINFSIYTISPRYAGTIDICNDTSNTTHYIYQVTGTYINSYNQTFTVTKVLLLLKYDSVAGSTISTTNVLFLVDDINPPITLNPDDGISVTWYVIFPKQEPYTLNFWNILKIFMGTDGAPDFPQIPPKVYFELFNNGTSVGRVTFDKVVVWTGTDGFYVKFLGHFTASSPTTIDEVAIELYADAWTGPLSNGVYYKMFDFKLANPIALNSSETVILRFTVKFTNFFTTG